MALERGLTKAGIPLNKKNIWDDPNNADFVRSVANGSETVPTVVVGSTAMVNPRVGKVIQALHAEAPHLVPEGTDAAGPIAKLTKKLFGS